MGNTNNQEKYITMENVKKVRKLYPNGSVLVEGSFDNNGNGYGKHYYKSGVIAYVGDFKLWKYSGNGVFYRKNGKLMYMGQFENNKMNGHGEYIAEDLRKYIGELHNCKLDGKGAIYDKNGNLIRTGSFSNNQYLD